MTETHTANSITIVDPNEFEASFSERDRFALEVLVGLSESRKRLPSRFMYDDEGSRLFTRITEMDVYYPTECEIETLRRNVDRIVSTVGSEPFNLVEFGPGNGRKARILIEPLLEAGLEFDYVPIDIAREYIDEIVTAFRESYPTLSIKALVSDYFAGLKWLTGQSNRKNIGLFLGSNIGNFSHAEARIFLRNMWSSLNPDDTVIIGFDLKKDIEMLLLAYNDPGGITAEFNLNLLRRINREIGGHFDCAKFRHFGTYDVFSGGMESYLVSKEDQTVAIDGIGRSFSFKAWEPIHTEYSYKYLISDIEQLARDTGFVVKEHLFDSNDWFVDSIWTVHKDGNADGDASAC